MVLVLRRTACCEHLPDSEVPGRRLLVASGGRVLGRGGWLLLHQHPVRALQLEWPASRSAADSVLVAALARRARVHTVFAGQWISMDCSGAATHARTAPPRHARLALPACRTSIGDGWLQFRKSTDVACCTSGGGPCCSSAGMAVAAAAAVCANPGVLLPLVPCFLAVPVVHVGHVARLP